MRGGVRRRSLHELRLMKRGAIQGQSEMLQYGLIAIKSGYASVVTHGKAQIGCCNAEMMRSNIEYLLQT